MYPTQTYGSQNTPYSRAQESSWTATNYGSNRETTSRAAEVLRNMSNNTYAPSTTASVTPSAFTATNSATASAGRYSTGATQAQQHIHSTHTVYENTQAQSQSTNTNTIPANVASRGLPAPALTAVYHSQGAQVMYSQQRPASPAQNAYTPRTTTPSNTGRSTAMPATNQHHDYNRRPPTVEAPRSTQSTATPTLYGYANNQVAAPAQTVPVVNVTEQYGQNAATVDPMAVYDPWPEYQRKQEALRAQKAREDAARAEEQKMEEARLEEERMRLEEEERARRPPLNSKKNQSSKDGQEQPPSDAEASSSAGPPQELFQDEAAKLEAEIRAMMAKMRELNGKDPALLARIWEEERRSKVPKSPVVQSNSTPQPAASRPVTVPQNPSQKKKPTKDTLKDTPSTAVARPPSLTLVQPAATKPQTVASSARPAGNTIWPPEKKSQLANAAVTYLNANNASKLVDADKILSMLDSNPSYIELCEQLESMGLRLDRAAFAKSLLTAVPDVNSASRQSAPKTAPNGAIAQRAPAPPAIPAKKVAAPVAASPQYTPAAAPIHRRPFPPFSDNRESHSHSPVPVAEMVPIKAELKPPANKEEAARKRNFKELIDLTLVDEEEDMGPLLKKQNMNSMYSYGHPGAAHDKMDVDIAVPQVNNFPVAPSIPQVAPVSTPQPQYSPTAIRYSNVVQPLDKRKALRRNTYNIKTIARDVLLACGRHPDERQLNAHLDILRINLPQITSDADLSTIRWDLIDPGEPPKGYFQYGVQGADAGDADDESTDDEHAGARSRASAQAIGGEARVQALPEATNPFKAKRRGRPRHSSPANSTPMEAPRSASNPANTSVSTPRSTAGSVGYSAFRSATEHGPDGQHLPKKKGRPVGWRKAIHGSPAAQSRPSANGHTGRLADRFVPSQPSSLRNVRIGGNEPIFISSRSPSVANKVPQYQSFKCRWQNCKAELHNLETLKKHVVKLHRKETLRGTLECLWGDCGREVASVDQVTNTTIERHTPFAFTEESRWREHLEIKHFSPILWELGDGPASGLSGKISWHAWADLTLIILCRCTRLRGVSQ